MFSNSYICSAILGQKINMAKVHGKSLENTSSTVDVQYGSFSHQNIFTKSFAENLTSRHQSN